MKILLSWSSGKDSAWALHLLNQTHPGSVAGLLTSVNESVDRVAMHGVSRDVLEAQAAATGLPLRVVGIPHPCSNDVYDARMGQAVARAVEEGFTHVAFGDLFLEEVRRYREDRLTGTGLLPLFPVWGIPTPALAGQMLDGGLRATLACIDTQVLDPSLVGREWNRDLLTKLPSSVDPCGENGEFHTCVFAGPMFSRSLTLEVGEQVTREPFTWVDLVRRDAGAATATSLGAGPTRTR